MADGSEPRGAERLRTPARSEVPTVEPQHRPVSFFSEEGQRRWQEISAGPPLRTMTLEEEAAFDAKKAARAKEESQASAPPSALAPAAPRRGRSALMRKASGLEPVDPETEPATSGPDAGSAPANAPVAAEVDAATSSRASDDQEPSKTEARSGRRRSAAKSGRMSGRGVIGGSGAGR